MTDHTPGPYRAVYTDLPYGEDMSEGWTVDGPEGSVCTLDCPLEDREAMAERIAAALNACAGIPTEQLGDVKALVEATELLLKTAQHFERQASKGTGGRRGGPVFTKTRAALAPFRKD